MTTLPVAAPAKAMSPGALFIVGIILAALAEAVASTALALGRSDMIGDTSATPDDFAWLDVGYIGLKLIGFIAAPWLLTRFGASRVLVISTLAIGFACALTAMIAWLELLMVLRVVQGFAGGVLLVAGQTIIFLAYPRARQPGLQAIFATGAVVAPATLAPALQGWLIDSQSWAWIFFSVVPIALSAAGVLLIAGDVAIVSGTRRPFDWRGLGLISIALCCSTLVLSQGSRWNWFEEPRIVLLSTLGVGALVAFVVQQKLSRRQLLDYRALRSNDFAFAFVVSFVAGAALFGSAFLIPAFAVSVLAFTPTAAGLLLLPSGAVFVAALLIAAFLVQGRGVPAIAGAPVGILALMAAMWALSGSTLESGTGDMGPALLLRGLGLGFLFLAITLIAFGDLEAEELASGIGLFNAGRQLGGLMGVAGLQTLIEHNIAVNMGALGANVSAGTAAAAERLMAVTALLQARGLDPAAAQQAALGLLTQSTAKQAAVIAFDTAFAALVLLFVIAAPIVISLKIALSRRA